jgi:hypothetical protein
MDSELTKMTTGNSVKVITAARKTVGSLILRNGNMSLNSAGVQSAKISVGSRTLPSLISVDGRISSSSGMKAFSPLKMKIMPM